MMLYMMMLLILGARAEPQTTSKSTPFSSIFDPLLVLSVRSSVVELFKIPSGSMYPTLHVGDQIWVRKWAYRANFPLTRIPITTSKVPQRGDVIVFEHPTSSHARFADTFDFPIPGFTTVDYVKRVIGLPGERVAITDGVVVINDQPLAQKFVAEKSFAGATCRTMKVKEYTETTGTKEYSIYRNRSPSRYTDFPLTTVPPDMVFVMGDNRDNSADSRTWGFVPIENIKGKVVRVFFSTDPCTGKTKDNRKSLPLE